MTVSLQWLAGAFTGLGVLLTMVAAWTKLNSRVSALEQKAKAQDDTAHRLETLIDHLQTELAAGFRTVRNDIAKLTGQVMVLADRSKDR